MKNTIYFIAVNFNNASFTIKYLNSIAELHRDNYEVKILITDNASEPADLKLLSQAMKSYPFATLIPSSKNLGYFGGLNLAIEQVDTGRAAYVFIGNNDLTFPVDFLLNLSKLTLPENVFAIAPDVVTANGIHQNPMCRQRMSKFRKAGLRFYYTNYYYGRALYHTIQMLKGIFSPNKKTEESCEIYMGIGACYILTTAFFKHFDRLWDEVFLWSEEALFAGQLQSKNGKMLYVPALIVYHAENTSVKKIPSRKTYEMAKKSFLKTYKYY